MDKELDKMVDAAIEDAMIAKHQKYNFDEEVANADPIAYKPWIYRNGN
jgi:hypothetical protein